MFSVFVFDIRICFLWGGMLSVLMFFCQNNSVPLSKNSVLMYFCQDNLVLLSSLQGSVIFTMIPDQPGRVRRTGALGVSDNSRVSPVNSSVASTASRVGRPK